MSIWFYLEEFFTDIPTLGTLLRRIVALVFLLTAALIILAIYEVPAPIAAVVYFGTAFAMMRLFSRYRRQRAG